MSVREKAMDALRKRMYLNTNMFLTDNTTLELENYTKVLEYNDIYLRLQTSTLILQIWGKNLSVTDYNTDGIMVHGEISSIEFEKKRRKGE